MDKKRIQHAVKEILIAIGEDPQREGLLETPARVANMYEEIFSGLSKNPCEEAKIFHEKTDGELIVIQNISFYSLCEHHLLPFYGSASVVYLPNERGEILGLSKVARMVDILARKPQVQERLSREIAQTINSVLHADGVLVLVEAEHLCMTMRGIKKPGAKTVTLYKTGVFETDRELRKEALSLLSMGKAN